MMPLLKRTHKIPSNRINTQLLMSSCIDNVLPFHFHRDSLFSFEFPCPSNSGEFHFSCRLTSRSCAPARSPTRQFWLELRAMLSPLCYVLQQGAEFLIKTVDSGTFQSCYLPRGSRTPLMILPECISSNASRHSVRGDTRFSTWSRFK